MATRYLVQQKWPTKWGQVAVFRSMERAQAWIDDAKAHGSTAEMRISPPKAPRGTCPDCTMPKSVCLAVGGCQP